MVDRRRMVMELDKENWRPIEGLKGYWVCRANGLEGNCPYLGEGYADLTSSLLRSSLLTLTNGNLSPRKPLPGTRLL